MKGTVTNWRGNSTWGFITGDDGVEYFLQIDGMKFHNCYKGVRVEFDIQQEGKSPRAINVVKLSHGKHHPFIRDLEKIEALFRKHVPDCDPEKQYALRDFQMLYSYFEAVEDARQFVDVRKEFRPKKEAE